MTFMQMESVEGTWLLVEVRGETHYVGPDLVGLGLKPGETLDMDETDQPQRMGIFRAVRDYIDCPNLRPQDITEIESRRCWGARFSAPGYMDCTDWTLADTQEEAENECRELYGDEEDETEDDEE